MTLQFHLRGWKGTAMANHLMNEEMTQMRKWIAKEVNNQSSFSKVGHGGVVFSALDFRSEGRWFDAQSLPSCCFLKQETLPHIVSLYQGV